MTQLSPLEQLAGAVIQQTHGRLTPGPPPAPRPALTAEERRDAAELIKRGDVCRFCAGLHVGASGPACPRLAAGKLNGDGAVTEFTYWRDGEWDTSRLVFAADLDDDDDGEPAAGAGDGA